VSDSSGVFTSETGSAQASISGLVGAAELVRLRWVAVIGQLVTVVVVRFGLGIELPMVPLSCLILLTAASNVTFAAWVGRSRGAIEGIDRARERWVLAMILALDLTLLTAMLYFTGGVANPFALFYMVNLGLSASVVERRWAWGLFALTAVGYLLLLIAYVDLPVLRQTTDRPGPFGTSLPPIRHWGSLAAFLACGAVIVHFSARVNRELRLREQALRDAGEQRARTEKLEALATLAAGAAHELATPLSTIAVVAKELDRTLGRLAADPSAREDMGLIRREVDRCRTILDRMASDAGQPSGEPLRISTVGHLLERVVAGLDGRNEVVTQFESGAESARLRLPIEGTAQALRGLVRNAIDASPSGLSIVLSAALVGPNMVALRVRDRGSGMTEAILQRVSEPFFTTKPPGAGMGLGVFLARTLVERLGGSLSFESAPHQGTVATVLLPLLDASANERPQP